VRKDVFRQKEEEEDGRLQHIAAAAPQLQQLQYNTRHTLSAQGVSSIASLRRLASLQLVCQAEDGAQLARALTALPGLAHLSLSLAGESSQGAPQLMQALGQLTGLFSLSVDAYAHHGDSLPLAPLSG
jgi:hypothetical protein